MTYLTLQRENLFTFTCPVVDRPAGMSACAFIRDAVYSGKAMSERRDCQVAIKACKCPAAEIIRRIAFNASNATDQCSSVETKHGKLPGDILDMIIPVLVPDHMMTQHGLTQEQRDTINNSRDRIVAQAATAPRNRGEKPRSFEPVVVTKGTPRGAQRGATGAPTSQTPEPTSINNAAATGDLAAALNAA